MISLLSLILVLQVLVPLNFARRPTKRFDFIGQEQRTLFQSPTATGQLRYTHQQQQTRGGITTTIKYDVVHSSPTHSLYDMNHTHHVCAENSLSLIFSGAPTIETVGVDHVLAGRACGIDILRRVKSVQVKGNVVTFDTFDIELHEAFQHADVTVTHSKLTGEALQQFESSAADVVVSDIHKRERGLLDFITRQWRAFTNWLNDVSDISAKIYQRVKTFASGDLEKVIGLKVNAASWNYNGNGGAATSINIASGSGYDVKCDKCYANLDVGLTFRFKVSSFKLKKLELFVTGDAHLGVGIEATANKKLEYSKEIARLHLAPLVFAIGVVPIKIDTTIPVSIGAIVEPDSALTLNAWASATGRVQFGMVYNPLKRKLVPVRSERYTRDGGVSVTRGTANAVLYVQPVVVFDVNYIGGPNVGLRPYLEVMLESTTFTCRGRGRATINLGMSTSIGAHIKIKGILDPGPEFGPMMLSESKTEIASGCLSRSRSAHGGDTNEFVSSTLEPKPFLIGNVWSGVQTLQNHSFPCDSQYPHSVDFSMQLVSIQEPQAGQPLSRAEFAFSGTAIDDASTLTRNQTHLLDQDVAVGSCVFQHMMNATINWELQTVEMDVDQLDNSITYLGCTDVQIPVTAGWRLFSFKGNEGFTLKGVHVDQCVNTLLTQGTIGAPGLVKV